ncbi:MAG: indole-3-glycerol-phosphate synthase TrpC, partial [Thiohalocapsa sp.]
MTDTPDILKKILHRKVEEITARAAQVPMRDLTERMDHAPATRRFADALAARVGSGKSAVIAEVKKASPSKG